MNMDKNYKPSDFEGRIYAAWEQDGCFKGIVDRNKQPFSVVIPPPNITGQLHMGHALNNTIQDTIVRYKRMSGYSVLWQPGTDHASIATEVKIVDKMRSEGLRKEDVGREGFLKRAWEWKKEYGGRIVTQLKKLGSSCDWSREAFTMDEQCSKAVVKVFVEMYKEGLIYQGNRIINWCTKCKTALSDAEVEYEEQASFLWHLRYPIEGTDRYLVIATTRPETMLGDTGVAVNPKDPRYTDIVGKNVLLPLVNKYIPVVADEYVEMDFGSGAVKMTPAHDPNDYEVGKRHNLETIRVMNDDGTMNANAGAYQGMTREECRKKVVEDLQELGLIEKIEPYTHNVGTCYRCKTVVETIISKQWFVKMKPLAEPAIKAVRTKDIKFIPKRFEKTYFNWMENIRDWCISRQLWWGHRIPAYYCDECGETVVAATAPDVCPKCGCRHLTQDEDVLDTWFSSALWPFSTLGYPDKSEYLDYFYPTSVLITAYDIIFFWVARMIFSGLKHMGEKPFSDVLIHGIVRDSQGRKMSKSLGNGIDPLVLIEQYGADSLRYSLLNGIAPGNDTRFSEEKLTSCRNFMNKIWNASRFVLMNIEGIEIKDVKDVKKTEADKWILTRLNNVVRDVTKNLDKYELGLAAARLYDFVWSDFCDWYIELTKTAFYGDDDKQKTNTASVLYYVLKTVLKLLHPFVPFVTEEIYSNLPNTTGYLMMSDWPKAGRAMTYPAAAKGFNIVMDMIKTIRNVKSERNIAPSKKLDIYVKGDERICEYIKNNLSYIRKLSGVENLYIISDVAEIGVKYVSYVVDSCELYIPLGMLVDFEKEIARLEKEKERLISEIARSEKLLSNAGFLQKAPKQMIDAEKDKQLRYKDQLEKINAQIEALR